MLFMVIENFRDGQAVEVYRRFRDRGRMEPEGVEYLSSHVDLDYRRCFQLMEADDASMLDGWTAQWADLIDFEIIPVRTSAEALEAITPQLPGL